MTMTVSVFIGTNEAGHLTISYPDTPSHQSRWRIDGPSFLELCVLEALDFGDGGLRNVAITQSPYWTCDFREPPGRRLVSWVLRRLTKHGVAWELAL